LSEAAYIDASAFVKLFSSEAESEALIEVLNAEGSALVASQILEVEVYRTAVRLGGDAPARAARLMRGVVLLPFSAEVRDRSCSVGSRALRSLDAIHLATALSARERIAAIFTYDKRLAEASADAGLRVLAPA
jgi:predicted nucleic acid-binding protein